MTTDTAGTNSIPRATGLIIVEVRNSNPNGDPERDGAPRKRNGRKFIDSYWDARVFGNTFLEKADEESGKTGCSKTDVDIVLELIPYVYSHNRSLVRTQVEVLHAWYAKHNNQRGSCNDFDLIDALMPKKREAKDKPSAARSEYSIPNKEDNSDIFKQFEGKVTIEDLMDRMR